MLGDKHFIGNKFSGILLICSQHGSLERAKDHLQQRNLSYASCLTPNPFPWNSLYNVFWTVLGLGEDLGAFLVTQKATSEENPCWVLSKAAGMFVHRSGSLLLAEHPIHPLSTEQWVLLVEDPIHHPLSTEEWVFQFIPCLQRRWLSNLQVTTVDFRSDSRKAFNWYHTGQFTWCECWIDINLLPVCKRPHKMLQQPILEAGIFDFMELRTRERWSVFWNPYLQQIFGHHAFIHINLWNSVHSRFTRNNEFFGSHQNLGSEPQEHMCTWL